MEPTLFVCPECCSVEPGETVHVSTACTGDDPWSGVSVRIQCSKCRSWLPAHLAERWDDLTFEQAQKEWREVYRDLQL